MVIQAKVNGRLRQFIVDSGASNMLFKSSVSHVDLGAYFGPALGFGINGNFFLSHIYQLDTVQVGTACFTDFSFKVVDFKIKCNEEIYGIIGKEAMRHLSWLIEPDKKQISFAKEITKLPRLIGDTVFLSENRYGHQLYALGDIKGYKSKFVIDTGSNGFLTTSNQNQFTEKLQIYGVGSRGLGAVHESSRYWGFTDSISFGNFIPGSPVQVMVGHGLSSTLGLGFLRNYKFLLDWRNKILILEPLEEQSFISHGYGVGLEFNDANELVLMSYLENSSFHKMALPIGLPVECLNNHNLRSKMTTVIWPFLIQIA